MKSFEHFEIPDERLFEKGLGSSREQLGQSLAMR
jgi:hypothetical protein